MSGSYFTNQYRYMLGSWHPVRNPNSDIPAAGSKAGAALPSSFMVHDASYLRLKNLQLGYTLPSDVTKKFYVDNLRVYFSASNLFTLSSLSKLGIDPEAPSVNNGYYPQQRLLMGGVTITF